MSVDYTPNRSARQMRSGHELVGVENSSDTNELTVFTGASSGSKMSRTGFVACHTQSLTKIQL